MPTGNSAGLNLWGIFMGENFDLSGSKLVVRTDLDVAGSEQLRKLCDRLINEGEGNLTLDLSSVKHVHSFAVGVLTYLWMEASRQKQKVDLIVSPDVAELLERSGLGDVLKHRVLGREKGSAPAAEDKDGGPDSGT